MSDLIARGLAGDSLQDSAEIAQQINDMTDNGNLAKSKVLTQTEYDALVTAGTLDEHAEYIIVEEVV
jgi:hypothetical protein